MILVDANIIFYAEDALSDKHSVAKNWWDSKLSGHEPVGLAWITCLAYIRIFTNPRAVRSPVTTEQATKTVNNWVAQPITKIVNPGQYFWPIFQKLLIQGQANSNLSSDAFLAALAIENDCILYSSDADFSRFADLRWKNPLSQC